MSGIKGMKLTLSIQIQQPWAAGSEFSNGVNHLTLIGNHSIGESVHDGMRKDTAHQKVELASFIFRRKHGFLILFQAASDPVLGFSFIGDSRIASL